MLTGHHDIVVCPYHRLLLRGNDLQYRVDVCLGQPVAGIWHRLVPLGLSDETLLLLALRRNLHDLVIDHAVRERHTGEERHQVRTDTIAVDSLRLDRMDQCRQVYGVNIHKRETLDGTVTDLQVLIGALEVRHAESSLAEVKGHEAMQVLVNLLLVKTVIGQSLLLKDIFNFLYLGQKVCPFLGIVGNEGTALDLLRDNDKRTYLRIGTPFIETEIAL